MNNRRPRLQDIAKAAGVTKMTVSRYFNDPTCVAPKTREKISKIIDDTGFIPNKVPAIMSRSSSKAFGLVIPSFSNQVFPDVIDAIEGCAAEYGYSVLLMHTGYNPLNEEEKIAQLLSYQVDGIILSEIDHTALTVNRLEKSGIPVAEIMSLPQRPINIAIGIDYKAVTYAAVKSLIECGRKKPAYFGVRLDKRTLERQEGYTNAVKEFGITPCVYNAAVHSTFAVGFEMFKSAYDRNEKIDAIVCTNDDVAVGALMACNYCKIKVPEEVAVLGYNALSCCEASIPKLCSLATPRFEMGRAAVLEIIKQINQNKLEKSLLNMPVTLSSGGSLSLGEQRSIRLALARIKLRQLDLQQAKEA